MQDTTVQEPAGIAFFSVKSGETHYCKLEPTIQAYINSSDMGINASRGQDYGWRLDPTWVKRVRAFRRDSLQMSILTAKNDGRKPTTTQILYYLYGQELADFYEAQEENENPFEEEYQRRISSGDIPATEAAPEPALPQALADFQDAQPDDDDDLSDLVDVDDEDLEPGEPETPAVPDTTSKPAETTPAPATSTAVDPAKPGADKTVTTPAPKPANKPATGSQKKQ